MTDFQTERLQRAEQFTAELRAIMAELGEEWTLRPLDPDCFVEWRYMDNSSTGECLDCSPTDKGKSITFSASGWPNYRTEDGNFKVVTPMDVYKETPRTTARRDRPPARIARQIERNVLIPAMEVYAACRKCAAERQEYADQNNGARERLRAALDCPRSEYAPNLMYPRNIPGDAVHVEYRSPGDVLIRGVTTEEAITMLAALRQYRRPIC